MKLPKNYEPSQYEDDIYALWEKSDVFVPKNRGSSENYSIVMPPPNANANLHIGYELTAVLEDIPVRYHRMRGKAALLVPGSDHAGFETQVVYEKKLAKEGKSRFDFTREELYKQIWDFVAENRGNFESQLRRMGVSADWSRYTFTLDDKIVQRAYGTFKKMWDEGLIYRGERLVNFCTFHGTAFADIEVEYSEVNGHLWYIRYPLSDGSGELTIATTRPETMLGDTAIAVHPDDEQYKEYIGKTVKLPLTNREIPVIADAMVDREFGTGAVKITPAHDPNDYEVAKRHDLPFITVIDHEGKITHDVPEPYRGLKVDEARGRVERDLKEQGLLVKVEDHVHSVGHCYKCGTIIQPLLRDQWFIDMQPLAKQAIEALKANHIAFYPEAKKDQLIHYLEGLRDWNISRQIAWGIPIPAFQNLDNTEDWIFDERVGEEFIENDGKKYRRDPDVFDTWFSSSSWPYATLDFPEGEDFKHFYPLNLMETGGEILYPWVSRMIMLGLYTTGKIPFKAVYIHGYVMAEDGSKMSKSVGNGIYPMPEIDKYGSDALRMGIISGRAPAVNRGYDSRRVEEARNFSNKLWNVARFIEDKIGDDAHLRHKPEPKNAADYWILTKLQHSTEVISDYLDEYRFAEAYENLYHFVWDDFADWYIEASKVEPNNGVLAYGLETILKLLHPFAPFMTETIWQTLAWEKDSILAIASWPDVAKVSAEKGKDFEETKQVVSEIRYLSSELHLDHSRLYYTDVEFIKRNSEMICRLAGLKAVTEVDSGFGLQLMQTSYKAWLDVDHETAQQYINQLDGKLAQTTALITQLEKRLANDSYVHHAPKNIVNQTRKQLDEAKSQLNKLSEEKVRFSTAAKEL